MSIDSGMGIQIKPNINIRVRCVLNMNNKSRLKRSKCDYKISNIRSKWGFEKVIRRI